MKKQILFSVFICLAGFGLFAQNNSVLITGKVTNEKKEPVPKASVIIKNSSAGTTTDDMGKFRLTVVSLPVTLLISSTEFEAEEIIVTNAAEISVTLQTFEKLIDAVVVGGDRIRGKLSRSAVSTEISGKADFINSPKGVYESLLSKKGLDVTISSITYPTYSTRGFNGSGSSKVNQLMDGMDNQAPGLNFSVGNFIGLTDLDVESIEILPGASSALYGPGGVNGTIIINSKNPFKFPGFSLQVKNGITDIGKDQRSKAGAFTDYSFRWAKTFNNKFAFKIGAQYLRANDWLANDTSNYKRIGATGKVVPGTRQTDPNYDGINVYGDETSVDIRPFLQGAIAANPGLTPILQPFLANPQLVSRSGYNEKDVIDPKTKNIKLSGAVHYKINNNLEAMFAGYWATGNTVFTGNHRYSLKDIKLGQYKIELRHNNWFLRGYTTQEDAGEAHSATASTQYLNEAWKRSFNPANIAGSWYPQYTGGFVNSAVPVFLSVFNGTNLAQAQAAVVAASQQLHNAGRGLADQGRPAAGSTQFTQIFDQVRKIPIPNGGLFLEKSQLWMYEGQYNFSEKIKFAELLVGGNVKKYILNSQGTLFIDTAGSPIKINEWGAYAQLSKKILQEKIVLSASARYDKNENFKGNFTPRFTALINVAEASNIRVSYQTAYKFPTTQQQWIKLDIGTIVLLGGLPWINNIIEPTKYTTLQLNPTTGGTTPWSYKEFKPESMRSFEIGYKSIIKKKLLIDVYAYFGKYSDFLGRVVLIQPTRGTKPWSIVVNSDTKINTWGTGFGFDYKMAKNYFSFLNAYTDNLTNVPTGFEAAFNTPKYRMNAGFGNSGLGKKEQIGFNVNFRWQDSFYWEGAGFADGTVKAYTTLDAQVNYKMKKIKSMIKLGGTNITNKFYQTGFGNPYIGGMYYVSFAYHIL